MFSHKGYLFRVENENLNLKKTTIFLIFARARHFLHKIFFFFREIFRKTQNFVTAIRRAFALKFCVHTRNFVSLFFWVPSIAALSGQVYKIIRHFEFLHKKYFVHFLSASEGSYHKNELFFKKFRIFFVIFQKQFYKFVYTLWHPLLYSPLGVHGVKF